MTPCGTGESLCRVCYLTSVGGIDCVRGYVHVLRGCVSFQMGLSALHIGGCYLLYSCNALVCWRYWVYTWVYGYQDCLRVGSTKGSGKMYWVFVLLNFFARVFFYILVLLFRGGMVRRSLVVGMRRLLVRVQGWGPFETWMQWAILEVWPSTGAVLWRIQTCW